MIFRKSNTGGCGGHGEETLPCKGEYTKLERDPCDLYNIKFCVWECIIIIGVGWGLTGGVKVKQSLANAFRIICIMLIFCLSCWVHARIKRET